MNTRRAGDWSRITIRAISNHAIESKMDASPALISGKVRITDHLFLLISLKKHVSRCPPVPPVNAAVGRAAVGVPALGGEGVREGAMEWGHGAGTVQMLTTSSRSISSHTTPSVLVGSKTISRHE